MEYVIETKGLIKKYKSRYAAEGVDLHIKRGEIYGFIGRNGAGKTTCMKMICGLAGPTEGEVSLFGKHGKESDAMRSRIGNLIEDPGLYYEMTAYQNLKCKCLLSGIHQEGYIEKILDLVGLSGTGKKKAGEFSLGMRQRLGIALALVGDPDILVLDEPINGLDPQGIAEMRNLFQKLRDEKNITIMISSHILEELAKLADTFGIIHNGKLIEEVSREELYEKCMSYVEVKTDKTEKVCVSLEESGITEIKVPDNNTVCIFGHLDDTAEINRKLITDGCSVSQIRIVTAELEDYYLSITGGNKNA